MYMYEPMVLCTCRKMLLCRVTLGKPVEHFAAIRIAHAPPGHHSVIGRPSAGGLNYPEYVIYRGEQVRLVVCVEMWVCRVVDSMEVEVW